MTAGDRRYTVEMLRAGQPRAYADTIHEFILSVEWVPYGAPDHWEPNDLHEKLIKQAGHAIGYSFYEKGQEPNWASPVLTTFKKLGPGKWRFVVQETFTD